MWLRFTVPTKSTSEVVEAFFHSDFEDLGNNTGGNADCLGSEARWKIPVNIKI